MVKLICTVRFIFTHLSFESKVMSICPQYSMYMAPLCGSEVVMEINGGGAVHCDVQDCIDVARSKWQVSSDNGSNQIWYLGLLFVGDVATLATTPSLVVPCPPFTSSAHGAFSS